MKNKKKIHILNSFSAALPIFLCLLVLWTTSCQRKPTFRNAKVISECFSETGESKAVWEWLEQESEPPLLSNISHSLHGNIYSKHLYEYNDQQLTLIHKDAHYSSPFSTSFSYDNQNRVITQTITDNDGVLGKATYTYNDRNQIVGAVLQMDNDYEAKMPRTAPWHKSPHAFANRLKKRGNGSKEGYTIQVEYTYNGGNLVKEVWDYGDGDRETTIYTYDHSINPFKGLWMLDEQLVLYPEQLSENNVLTVDYVEDGETDSNQYLYDEGNYPVAIIQSFNPRDTIRWKYKQIQYKVLDPK